MKRFASLIVAALMLCVAGSAWAQTATPTLTPTSTPTNTPTRQSAVINVVPAGAQPYKQMTPSTIAAASDGKFTNTGREQLTVVNESGSAVIVSILSVASSTEGRTGDLGPVTIAAEGSAIFGPFPKHMWNQTNGTVLFDTDTSSGVDVKYYVTKR